MSFCYIFFFNDTATTEIYTLSLHDALPISASSAEATSPRRMVNSSPPIRAMVSPSRRTVFSRAATARSSSSPRERSEEHTSELQSRQYLVCRLLLEKKKKIYPSSQQLN